MVIIPRLGDSEVDTPVRTFLRTYGLQGPADDFDHHMQVDDEDCASGEEDEEDRDEHEDHEEASGAYEVREMYHDRSHVVYAPVAYGDENHTYDEHMDWTPMDDHSDLTLMGEDVADDEDNVDITGLCFDPTGKRFYVATMHGVGEWSVRGAEKRWWGNGQFT